MRPLYGTGGTRREDSSLHLLAAEPIDHQRFGTVRRADHRDPGIPAGQDDPSCLPRLSLPRRVCGKTRPARQYRSAGPFLSIRARRHHQHCMGARQRRKIFPRRGRHVRRSCRLGEPWMSQPPTVDSLFWEEVFEKTCDARAQRERRGPGNARPTAGALGRAAVAIGLRCASAVNTA